MITFENTTVMNMKNAMMGARNPMNSWDRSDSKETAGWHIPVWTKGHGSGETPDQIRKRPP